MANAIQLLNSPIDELEIGWFALNRLLFVIKVVGSWRSIKMQAHEVGVVCHLAAEVAVLLSQVGKVKQLNLEVFQITQLEISRKGALQRLFGLACSLCEA